MRHAGKGALIVALAMLAGLRVTTQPAAPIVASASVAAVSRQSDAPVSGGRSAQNANYDIDIRLDHATRTLTGTEVVRWRNIGLAPADSLRLHLYWNAWRNPRSTWMREAVLGGADFSDRRADEWSSIDITAIALANPDGTPGFDLMAGLAFVQPDDANVDDRTLAAIALPAAVAPGAEIALRIAWTAHVPRTVARTGAIDRFYFIAHWFPKIAVFEEGRWTAHQFHANTEFFADYGRYDVRITVPRGWVVGATGLEQSRSDNADGTTTHRYVENDVHDFTWTTSPDYVEHRQLFQHDGLPTVHIRLLMQPEHAGQEDRHFAATAAALRYYGEWYSPYAYDHVTVIDPAFQSGAGGMEYPTLFTAGTRWLAPRQSNDPEAVTIHEAGHQFWYGMVGNNEVAHAWLDEGLNTFSEERVTALAFQPNYRVERFFGGFVPWQFRDMPLPRETDVNGLAGYRASAERDALATPTFRYWHGTHSSITYSKTALWLHTLERYLGWDTLQRIMSTFFERWKFRHPRPDDFFAVANEMSGQDLTWFFDQVYRSSNVFDYGVEQLRSVGNDSGVFETTVVVRRLGEATFPIDVETVFENGERVREKWDGHDRWRTYSYARSVRARSVQIDPDRVLLLDVNYANNSYTTTPQAPTAATTWSLKWMVWAQDLLMTWAFFV